MGLVVYSKKSSEEEKHKQKSEIQVTILYTIQSEVYWRVYCTANKKCLKYSLLDGKKDEENHDHKRLICQTSYDVKGGAY